MYCWNMYFSKAHFWNKRYSTRIKHQSQARRWVPWTRSHANRAKIRRTATGWRATRCKRVTPSESVRGGPSATSFFDSKIMWCSEVGSWELGASPTSLSWNRDPGVISKPRSNSSSSNLLETSSPFIIVFFRNLPNCDVYVYLRKYQSVPSSFSISLHLASPHSWQPADPTLSICILFAQKYYLPRKIICPELLFALKYCLPGNIICPEKFLLRNISCPETFFAQQYHLFRNIICSKILFF